MLLNNFKTTDEKIYEFFNKVITDKYLNINSKHLFLIKFWDVYIHPDNDDFKYFVNGKYLVWNNNKYLGIIESTNKIEYIEDCIYYFIQIPIL